MRSEVVLDCTHRRYFTHSPPKVGERIYCPDCTDMRKVTGAPGDYRAVCDSCTGLYVTRRSPEALRKQVVKHLATRPEHTVKIWQIGLPDVTLVSLPAPGHLAGFDQPTMLDV